MDATPTADERLAGLSYRVRVEDRGAMPGLGGFVYVANAEGDDGPQVALFDYLRVISDSVEGALAKVRDHHQQRYYPGQHPGSAPIDVYFLGFNIDGLPVPSARVLRTFEARGDSGWEWTVGFYGASDDDIERWRTGPRAEGLWRWTGHEWNQQLGTLQFGLPNERGAAVEALCRRWALTDSNALDHGFIGSAQVLELMASLGRPISGGTLANYRQRPPADWPGIDHYVGRTPQWRRDKITAYALAKREQA